MAKIGVNHIIAIVAFAAILVSGALYAKKTYKAPEAPPNQVWTAQGAVTIHDTAEPGDLVTAPDLKTVYYLNQDMQRVVFPDMQTYHSWYEDFSTVKHVSRETLESYPLSGRNATIRPGTYLITIISSNQVWMIGWPNTLHWLASGEEQVVEIFGENWRERLVDLPEYYFVNYTQEYDITNTTTYPTGLLVHAQSNDQYYLITPGGQRHVTEEGMVANHLQERFAIEEEEPLDLPFTGPPLDEFEPKWGSPDLMEARADEGPDDIQTGGASEEVG